MKRSKTTVIILLVLALCVAAAAGLHYLLRFQLTGVRHDIPVPAGMHVVKDEERQAGNAYRRVMHLEGDFASEEVQEYLANLLPEYGWEIKKVEERALNATHSGGRRARFVFHQEKHRTLVTINLVEK